MHFMGRTTFGLAAAASLLAAPTPAAAAAADVARKPPAGFVQVSEALKVPAMAFIPGLGTLWVDPKTLPAGPFLGYDKGGRLVNVTYMLPTAAIDKNQAWPTLGLAARGQAVDHTEVHVSGAHPGVSERHVHVINWLIGPEEKAKLMGKYPHLH